MKKRIAVFGEVLVDLLVSSDFASVVPVAGGSLYNTASSLSKLGLPCDFYSRVGDDLWGARLVSVMEAAGVDSSRVLRDPAFKTMLAFAARDAEGNATYDFYRGEQEAVHDFAGLAHAALFHFGSISSIFPENRRAVAQALEAAARGGAIVSYDPNYRAPFAAFSAHSIAHMKRAHILKASLEDFESLLRVRGISQVLRALDDFPSVIQIVTKGSEGALARIGASEPVELPAATVTVSDTIGAGDNFTAGYLCYLYENGVHDVDALRRMGRGELEGMIRFAVSIAAAALSVHGADVPRETLIRARAGLA